MKTAPTSDWTTTRKQWLKEIRLREPTWQVKSCSGQIMTTIEVKVGDHRYCIQPGGLTPWGTEFYDAVPLTQERCTGQTHGFTLTDLLKRIRKWSRAAPQPKKSKELLVRDFQLDSNDVQDIISLARALKPFGVTVTADPATEDSDINGLIFSNRPLTEGELADYAERM